MRTSIKSDQKGLGHVLLIAIIVLVVAIGGVGYYVWNKQKDKDASDSSTTKQSIVSDAAVSDACNKALGDKDFCKFAGNWKGLESYKSTIVTSGANGNSTIMVEVQNENRSRTVVTQDGKEVGAYVTVDKTFYSKNEADGSWTKYTSGNNDNTTNIKDDLNVEDFTDASSSDPNKTQYKKIGKEACGSLTCFKYQIIDPADKETEQFIWFDTKDYLLRKWTSKGGEGTTELTISYEKVTVSEPSPVKDAPQGTPSDNPTPEEIEAALRAAQSAGDN